MSFHSFTYNQTPAPSGLPANLRGGRTREFVGYELREGCFDPQKENLYVCSMSGLYKKQIDIKKLVGLNTE